MLHEIDIAHRAVEAYFAFMRCMEPWNGSTTLARDDTQRCWVFSWLGKIKGCAYAFEEKFSDVYWDNLFLDSGPRVGAVLADRCRAYLHNSQKPKVPRFSAHRVKVTGR